MSDVVSPQWLERKPAPDLPLMKLCLSRDQFIAVLDELSIKEVPRWVSADGNATMHTFEKAEDGLCCIVCLDGHKNNDEIAVMALLCHEAVHIWQAYAESIGEREPASEQMAYGIQLIFQNLAGEFIRLTSDGSQEIE